jgi:S-adenosylmethionine synthetase
MKNYCNHCNHCNQNVKQRVPARIHYTEEAVSGLSVVATIVEGDALFLGYTGYAAENLYKNSIGKGNTSGLNVTTRMVTGGCSGYEIGCSHGMRKEGYWGEV